MKTLIVLGATNVFLGFTSFVLSNHVKTRDRIQANNDVVVTHKEFIKPVKTTITATAKIKTKTRITRKKIKPPVLIKPVIDSVETGLDDYNYMQLMDKAEKLERFAKENGYSTGYGFLINMGMKSGKKRFFVIDLSSMVIMERGIVSRDREASLGIYKVDRADTSYRLFGLQQNKNNACKRAMRLHAMDTIPENEVERPIFQSNGSPTIAPSFFTAICSIVGKNEKPVLMWIFDTEKESELVNCQ